MVSRHEWQIAGRAVWGLVSAVCLLALVTPFVIQAQTLAAVVPVCEAKRAGGWCFACGLTTSFYSLASGEWRQAAAAHRGGAPLAAAMLLNTAAAAWRLLFRRRVHGRS